MVGHSYGGEADSSNLSPTTMKYKYISLFLLMVSLTKISANASAGVWEYVDEIPTEPIHVMTNLLWQEQTLVENIEPEQPLCEGVEIVGHSGMKTWMPHNLFGKKTLQYSVQQLAVTDSQGFRGIAGRYCVAVGSRVTTKIGQLIDVVLANGEVIPCVVADAKNDAHTDTTNTFTVASGCCCEFIVDSDKLVDKVRKSGDVSSLYPEWDSPIVEFRVYEDLNVLD